MFYVIEILGRCATYFFLTRFLYKIKRFSTLARAIQVFGVKSNVKSQRGGTLKVAIEEIVAFTPTHF